MIKFYYNLAPNPMKVALMLEETGLAYEPIPIDSRRGDQHTEAYRAINPNAKAPALVDGDVTVFDSNAILMYLGEKTGQFMPAGPQAHADLLSWMMFVATGIGPYSGQAVHFRHHAPEKLAYAINRYSFEVDRHYGVLDARLGRHAYTLGDSYSIVDMAVWGWARMLPYVKGEDAFTAFPNVARLVNEITARPAAVRALAIKDRFAFKAELDEEARRNLFPQNYAQKTEAQTAA